MFYLQLRHSLIHGNHKSCDAFFNPNDNNEDNEYDDGGLDFGPPDFDMPEGKCEYEEVPSQPEKVRQINYMLLYQEAVNGKVSNYHRMLMC